MRTRYHILDLVAHSEFFETIDRYPVDESFYMAPARALLPPDWTINRQGIWSYCDGPDRIIPGEGWKMHVAGTTHTAPTLLERLVPLFVEEGVSFKFAADRVILSMMNGKRWNRGGSGKFMTVYPHDAEHFRRLVERAHALTSDLEGPYILSDRRYRDSRVVFYRYGTMMPQSALAADGRRVSVFIAADGSVLEDRRDPAYAVPPWAVDPFGEPDPVKPSGPITMHDGRFVIDHPIAFSNSGGVYVAKDLETDASIIVKEARPRTNWTAIDVDATVLLAKEHRLLDKLKGTGFTPQPIALFREWEHLFLAQERIFGYTLHATGVLATPLIMVSGTEDKTKFIRHMRDVCSSLADAIRAVHAENIIFGDLSPTNVLWLDDTRRVMLLDLEGAVEIGIDKPPRLTTQGFEAPGIVPGYEPSFDDDWYSYGALVLNFIFPIAEMTRLPGVDIDDVITRLCEAAGFTPAFAQALSKTLSGDKNRAEHVRTLLRELDAAAEIGAVEPPRRPLQLTDRSTVEGMAAFVLAHADATRPDRLFPADFRVFTSNGLGVAYGAAGVLNALHDADIPVPTHLVDWLAKAPKPQAGLPPGFSQGSAGIAWALLDLGRDEDAHALMVATRRHPLIHRTPSLGLGTTGWGLTNLRFYFENADESYLREATDAADHLLANAVRDEDGLHWTHGSDVLYGLYHGASGTALFFAYLAQVTGREDLRLASLDAMRFELSRGSLTPDGALSWSYGTSFSNIWLPYQEYGSAGIGSALLRVMLLGGFQTELAHNLDLIFADTRRKFSVTRGIHNGLAGIGMFHLDALQFTGDTRFADAAQEIADSIMFYARRRPDGIAFPGDILTRITCDYATGAAGIMMFFERLRRGGDAPYLLDGFVKADGVAANRFAATGVPA